MGLPGVHSSTEVEIARIAGAMAGMDNGWGGGYMVLDKMFAELQA